jgi:PAS domain S-box-containing protein
MNQPPPETDVVDEKDNSLQSDDKEMCAAELVIANKELSFQNDEKEKRAAELVIANKELIIAATVFESQEGIMVTDANNVILRVNNAFTDITGYSAEDVVGQIPSLLSSGMQSKEFYATMWASINSTGKWKGEVLSRRKNGDVYPEYLHISAVKNIQGIVTNYVTTRTDITLSKAASDEIERLAFYDPLTSDIQLAVNVSAKQLHQIDFVEQLLAIIQRHGTNPTRLKLELTESMLLDNIHDIIGKMNALNKIGIHFSLDDFGTGYSSLQYLKLLPIEQLKIDQSFVRDIVTDSSDRAIVRTIITMASSLGINVIAEGVETTEQRRFLLDNGCLNYQGYLFGKPVPVEDFEAILKKAAGKSRKV